MKKYRLLPCLLLALAMLAGCTQNPGETTAPTETSAPTETTVPVETTLPPETTVPVDPELQYFRENLPTMDGSTSLIPLEAGIRAAIFGISQEDATAQVSHTTTWGSFDNLLMGTVDLIFSVDLSEDQYRMAADAGITLETVPIAKEGFVFVVNASNPVDTLTQEQIRAIYSGEITNWSQVGGNDEPIIAYQRNTTSGSQNYMTAFMGDTPLMDAPTEMRPASMSGLMDVIAVNDNSSAAIGYSVYAYAADMYGNGNEIKFIQVDGVAPSKASFADGSYPLIGYNYVVFNADQPEDSPVRRLTDWILSIEGQTAIAQAGYVTITDIGYDYREMTLTKYQATGTGAPAADPPSSEYVMYTTEQTEWGTNTRECLMPEIVTLPDGTKTYRVTQLADTALQDEINAFIDEQMATASDSYQEMLLLLDGFNAAYQDYTPYYPTPSWYMNAAYEEGMPAACRITCSNGYLSVVVSTCYHMTGNDEYDRFYRTETATWDLLSEKRLEVTDLFCEGVDIAQVLNEYIRPITQQPIDDFLSYEMKMDFAGLTNSGWHLTHDAIYFDHQNPYFAYGVQISLDDLPDGTLVSEALRDCSTCFIADDLSVVQQFRIYQRDLYYKYNSDELVYCGLLEEDAHPNAAVVNASIMEYLDTYYTEDAIRGYYEDLGYSTENLDLFMMDWGIANLGNRYLYFRGYAPDLYLPETEQFVSYPYADSLLYDLNSGEQISWRDILKDGWESAAVWDSDAVPPSGFDAQLDWFSITAGEGLRISFVEDGLSYYAMIPSDQFLY